MNIRIPRRLGLAIALLVGAPPSLGGCSPTTPTAAPVAFSNDSFGFSCAFDPSWTKSDEQGYISLAKEAPAGKVLGMNVGKLPIPGGVTATGDMAVLGPQCADAFKAAGATDLTSSTTTLGGEAAVRYVMAKPFGGQPTTQQMVLAVHGAQFYMVQLVASPELYGTHVPAFQAVVDSFEFR